MTTVIGAKEKTLDFGPVITMFADTMSIDAISDLPNNDAKNIDLVIPCNNKGKKSLAVIFFVLAREFLKNKEIIKSDKDFTATIEDFTAE